jgi:hypothetical protein
LGILSSFVQQAHAQAVPTPSGTTTPVKTPAATTPKPTVAATPAPAKPAAPVPAPMPESFNRYGKILAPSDDVAHPVKLNVQFPGVGEMKIPSQDELNARTKLEQLATLSDDEIRKQLAIWPPFQKMKLGDQGQMLLRIQQFRDQRTRVAMDKARELGIVNMTPDQKVHFEKEYWDKRLQMDRELAKQFEPIFKAREEQLREDLFREFSAPGVVVPNPAAGAKPPAIPVAQGQPAPSAAPGSTAPANTNPVH